MGLASENYLGDGVITGYGHLEVRTAQIYA
jgi:hypothetical protein